MVRLFPNDLVYCCAKRPDPPAEFHSSKMAEVECSDASQGNELEDNGNFEDATIHSCHQSLALTLPEHRQPLQSYLGFVNFPMDVTSEKLKFFIKQGFDPESTRAVPFTGFDSGETHSKKLNSIQVALADRYLDVNSWVKVEGKIGQIKSIKSYFDLHVRHSSYAIKGVPESDIELSPEFYPGLYVYLNGWIGCVKTVRNKLLVRYNKGHECYVLEEDYVSDNSEEFQFPKPDFQFLHQGDIISPSSRDIKYATWLPGKAPGWFQWIFLRWLNWGYTESTCATVVENSIDSVVVEWSIPDPVKAEKSLPLPPSKIYGELLENLMKLEMNFCWYGLVGLHKMKDSDIVEPLHVWGQKLVEKIQFPISFSSKTVEQPTCKTGDTVIAKIIGRQATARVRWEDDSTSDVPLTDLVPYFLEQGQENPFAVGEVVIKNIFGNSLKLLYGIVQKCKPGLGLCFVKWFGSESDVLTPIQVKIWDSTEAVESLQICNEFKFAIGMIVFTRLESVPGVVIGNNLSGQVYVKTKKTILKYFAYELYKFESIAYSINYGRDVVWSKLEDSSKRFLNQKHIGSNFSNLFNVSVPASIIHSIPEINYYVNQFEIRDEAPSDHRFIKENVGAGVELSAAFQEAWKEQVALLKMNHARGIWIKVYADRLDLMSILISGMPGSLYEASVFQFDVCLPAKYPSVFPLVMFLPKYGVDRLAINKFHTDLMTKSGLLKLESLLKGKANTPLWLIFTGIQEELFGVHHMLKSDSNGDYQGAVDALKNLALTSYTSQFQSGIQNQIVLRNTLNSMNRWLISPPSLWEKEAWEFWKSELPLFIAKIKRVISVCEQHQIESNIAGDEAQLELLVNALLPADPVVMCDINYAIRDLSATYCKLY